MAATNTTTNYGFPLYNESDSTSWADFNKLSTDADAKIKEVADAGGTTNGQVQELTTKVDTLTQTVNAQDAVITQQGTEITKLTNDAAVTDEAIDGLQQKANANETNISNLSTQVAETILPEVEKNTTDIATISDGVTTLSATVSQQGTRITILEGKVPNDLGAQLTTLTNGLDEVQGEIAGGFDIAMAPGENNYGITLSAQPGDVIVRQNTAPNGVYYISFNLSITGLTDGELYQIVVDAPTSNNINPYNLGTTGIASGVLSAHVSFIANLNSNAVIHIRVYKATNYSRQYSFTATTNSLVVKKISAIN